MFNFTWNPLSLTLAGLASLFFAFVLSYLLHLRYDKQFGWSFLLIGLLSIGPPVVCVLGVVLYLILESGLDLIDRALLLGALIASCSWTLWRLKKRMLSKIFKPLTREQMKAMAERYAAEEAERLALKAAETEEDPYLKD